MMLVGSSGGGDGGGSTRRAYHQQIKPPTDGPTDEYTAIDISSDQPTNQSTETTIYRIHIYATERWRRKTNGWDPVAEHPADRPIKLMTGRRQCGGLSNQITS